MATSRGRRAHQSQSQNPRLSSLGCACAIVPRSWPRAHCTGRLAAVALSVHGGLPQINDAIRGTSFVDDDDDPFEGLSPAEIEARRVRMRGCNAVGSL